jgi:hypothetical protein
MKKEEINEKVGLRKDLRFLDFQVEDKCQRG